MVTIATNMGLLTGMTSRPIPSPGIKPIRSDLEAIGGSEWRFYVSEDLEVNVSSASTSSLTVFDWSHKQSCHYR